jgi:RNA polymerase sigma-70 factor (ECF subfamily)
MSADNNKPNYSPAMFMTTRWSMVRAAAGSDDHESQRALATLCQQYWYPIYAHIRRRGKSDADSEDLTQEFFSRLIEKHDVQNADPELGRFRNYLLGAVDHFLANQHDRDQSLKRRGKQTIVSIDRRDAENRLLIEPKGAATPEQGFERSWAITLLDRIGSQLRDEYTASGRADLFDELRPHLPRNSAPATQKHVASKLAMSTDAVKVAIHRLHQRFGRLLRSEILQTVSDEDEIDDEIQSLHKALSQSS